MKRCSGEKQFVLDFIGSTNVSALHPNKAKYDTKESESQPAH